MDIQNELEYPIPILKVNIEKIVVKASRSFEGKFVISNLGGSDLEGDIFSISERISFSQNSFNENKNIITYNIDLNGLKIDDVLKSEFSIISNGGEKRIDVLIKIVAPVLVTKFDTKIVSLKEFYEFTKENPVEARFLFASQDFMIWLNEINFKNIDLYEYFMKDHNKERGLDNFFISCNLKNEIDIKIPNNKYVYKINPYENEISAHVVKIEKFGEGYMKSTISIKNSSPWLHLETKDITSLDFVNKDFKEISFYINAKYISDKYAFDEIVFDEFNKKISIEVVRKQHLKVYLSKYNFSQNDNGNLIIENFTSKDIVIEIFERDDFIKFEGKKYFIGKSASIPFEIKMSVIRNLIKKNPVVHSGITVRAYLDDKIIRKDLEITVGSLL